MTIDERDGVLYLGGALDEASMLGELPARARDGRIVLDLEKVTFINSLGVRDWIRMMAALDRAKTAVELRRVCEPVVQQLNMILAARGDAAVASFFAPYACDSCGREESMLVDAVAFHDTLVAGVAPPQTCPECGSKMSFNDFPERYFSFLSV
ncbi:MAG TPA: hypothetical protein VGM88_33090 [Kofleriaceae bacterium]|jgi:anti-anti-sigma regulatory factor